MKFKKTLIASCALLTALPLTNCARRIGAGQYASGHIGESIRTYEGVILAKRTVLVQEAERLSDNREGMMLGAGLGGVGGSMFGRGKGRTAATALGAIAGGAAGMMTQDSLGEQQGLEYTIRLKNGNMRTVVQGLDVVLEVGQKVILQESTRGRSRVVPATF